MEKRSRKGKEEGKTSRKGKDEGKTSRKGKEIRNGRSTGKGMILEREAERVTRGRHEE